MNINDIYKMYSIMLNNNNIIYCFLENHWRALIVDSKTGKSSNIILCITERLVFYLILIIINNQ